MAEQQQDPEQIEVTLRPILGVAPRIYVPVVYSLLAALLLFLVLVLPGIRNHGSQITIRTTPANAAVFVDGDYAGSTPGELFVPAGDRELRISRPGFTDIEQTMEIHGRYVASLLFPRRESLHFALDPVEADGRMLVRAAAEQFSHWNLSGEASARFEMPPIARALAEDLSALESIGTARESWEAFLASALPVVASEASLMDLTAGTLAIAGESEVATPAGIAAAIEFLADAPATLPVQLADIVRRDSEQALLTTAWYEHAEVTLSSLSANGPQTPDATTTLPVVSAGVRWIPVPSGRYVLPGQDGADRGGEYPRVRTIAPLYVSETEISRELYASFLSDRSFWRADNIESLVAAGLVDQHYLSEISIDEQPNLPITSISIPAAEAFAAWLTEQTDLGTVRLPTEDEWDAVLQYTQPQSGLFAAQADGGPVAVADAGGNRGVFGMLGNVWEWTATPFAQYSFLYPADQPEPAPIRHVVRGGGWATGALGFSPWDRGALAPNWTSPFVGFRVVLVPDR